MNPEQIRMMLLIKVSLVEGMFSKDAPTADKSVQLGLF